MKTLTCRVVKTIRGNIVTGTDWPVALTGSLKPFIERKQKIFILADNNTAELCLPILLSRIPELQDAEVFQIMPGEDEKSIDNAVKAWNWLSNNGADRHSLLINLGGGVVTDLGGFVASTYLRGIGFINIPTTLMGMADAAIGGKTAVNLAGIKNQAGTFAFPAMVYIIPQFLETLEQRHLLSGFAEILKSALIADPIRWKALKKMDLGEFTGTQPNGKVWSDHIFAALKVKNSIVRIDPFERKERKLLNFGHTIGHAFEALRLNEGAPVTHGEAVSVGMVCGTFLSNLLTGLSQANLEEISSWIISNLGYFPIATNEIDEILKLMAHDKKSIAGSARFTLLVAPGKAKMNIKCSEEQVRRSLEYYQALDPGLDNQ